MHRKDAGHVAVGPQCKHAAGTQRYHFVDRETNGGVFGDEGRPQQEVHHLKFRNRAG